LRWEHWLHAARRTKSCDTASEKFCVNRLPVSEDRIAHGVFASTTPAPATPRFNLGTTPATRLPALPASTAGLERDMGEPAVCNPRPAGGREGQPARSSSSAGQPGDRAKQIFIRGVRVDRGGQYRLVPGKALREADVLGLAVDSRAGRVA